VRAEGKRLSWKRGCKLLEVSALLDHRVDDLLVTVIRHGVDLPRRCWTLQTTSDESRIVVMIVSDMNGAASASKPN